MGSIMDESDSTRLPGSRLEDLLRETRKIDLQDVTLSGTALNKVEQASQLLRFTGNDREADALEDVIRHCTAAPHFGGLGYSLSSELDPRQTSEVLFLASAHLEALNYQDRRRRSGAARYLDARPQGRRGMTLSEKILAAHDIGGKGEVKPGDVIRLDVDWVIASELSWYGMEQTYQDLGAPGIFRNDRLWIAGDHVVDPRVVQHPKIKPLIDASEKARRVFKLTEYQGMNYTIMHTEFCRERAQPGMLVIGSDSHTCSAGSVSSLAIGLGVSDVTLPLITGETWIKVPETVEVRFINRPAPGLGGKDVILYILQQLKRNTVAAERIVEYTGPGLQYLSCDARFAICNMTTEFGGISGICVPDEITERFIKQRKNPKHKRDAVYYRPDEDASYAETYVIDLSQVESFIARYPSPDDVVPVRTLANTPLDGCFIGACTTAREDLILAATVIEVGLDQGMRPVPHGKRRVVPGSRPILHELEDKGLADVYRRAGFEIGVPGCSYCVGMSADKAARGEVWLSSQNRNFENRMGPGAIGSIASAVTVAASSFDMVVTDPAWFLKRIDMDVLAERLGGDYGAGAKRPNHEGNGNSGLRYVEPPSDQSHDGSSKNTNGQSSIANTAPPETPVQGPHAGAEGSTPTGTDKGATQPGLVTGKVQTLGDFIDTDALAPAEALVGDLSPEEVGKFCLYHTHPDFRRRIREEGLDIVVAGKAFGVGSSRENAVTALQGAGVRCVIARSFAFIYARNQPNLGLLGIIIEDDDFYRLATDGTPIEIDVYGRTISVGGSSFGFRMAELELRLWEQGGISSAFHRWGKGVLQEMVGTKVVAREATLEKSTQENGGNLAW